MDRQTNHFEDGHIVFTTDVDGKTIEIEGDVRDIDLTIETSYDKIDSLYDYRVTRTDTSAHMTFVPNENDTRFTIRTVGHAGTEVTHRASIVATDRTVAAFEKARKQVGAPKDAKIRMNRDSELSPTTAGPVAVEIEFIWTETV